MATALVIQHEKNAGAAWFGEWFAAAGLDVEVVHAHAGERVPTTVRHDALVVLGGAMGAYDDTTHPWLTDTKALLRAYVDAAAPCLGICLGHQLLTVATGGSVGRHPAGKQIGLRTVELRPEAATDPLLGGFTPPLRAVHWNNDVVTALPDGAVLLADDPHGQPEAYRLGPAAWGVQFHPEAGGDTVALWGSLDELGPGWTAADVDDAVRAVKEADDELRRTWSTLARRFVDVVSAAQDGDVGRHRR